MGAGTKKVGPSGSYGVRYGGRIRSKVADVKRKCIAKYECPICKKKQVKRVSKGVWQCKKCNHKFAGKAYEPWEAA
jgi:large subunit ribosomal protein L37Ae